VFGAPAKPAAAPPRSTVPPPEGLLKADNPAAGAHHATADDTGRKKESSMDDAKSERNPNFSNRTFGQGEPPDTDASSPAAPAGDATDAEAQSEVDEIRSLFAEGRYERAREACESKFLNRPELRDQWGHPIYYKEMMRISLALGYTEAARDFAERLRALIDPEDACVDILYARHFASKNADGAARAAWHAVLERSLGNPEALAWLAAHPEHAT
jgi:hypothetical protein